MTDDRFNEVGQALDDFFDGINRAKDAVAVLKTLMRKDAYWVPQYLRDAEAALNDAANAVDFEPCDDEFDDEEP